MAQRVTIALALCSRAKLLIADEPTNGLDEAAKARFMHLLGTLFPEAGKLVITHDISVAAMCDRILVLCRGRAMETGKATDVLTSPYHPYTKSLLAALVENGMRQTPVHYEKSRDCARFIADATRPQCNAGRSCPNRKQTTENGGAT